ncbi:hypothetical protein CHGG_07696 [Chaetomium globosum CBS 148.51]|uniref:Glycine cleavage system H protein n=1 Tax=Chaetomium globosum (strain ATCC 6205 / CBS 148.51 / DSM 1962 / NBRC 6347 / NRRL 1970) TaxID=306901 RepID=Q2GWF8_CHAGB|nr:uncharacterized protein CHGG_07696 [Chaetomium globosum CBS 148.51]EAQ86443.1 hypothetical protein CHGG_07696 [Chaetomium globosum CBS 148.51]
MASITRCLRVARPAAFSAVARNSVPRTIGARAFSVTASNAIKRYTKEHEWIDISADKKTGVLGISEYAAKQLGDIVYVELPEEGKDVKVAEDDSHGGGWIAKVQLTEQGVEDFEKMMDVAAYEEFTAVEEEH